MKQFHVILAMTALLGWLPVLLSILAVQLALVHGARAWPDIVFDTVFGTLYLSLVGVGAYVYSAWFKG